MIRSVSAVTCFVALVCLGTPSAYSAVVAGDIAIIGFRSDNPDGLTFVVLNSIDDGESINFWDSGFIGGGDESGEGIGGGTWRGTEDAFVWTNNTGSGVAPGTVIAISETTADLGGSSGSLTGLSASGDQIFAGVGDAPDGNPSIFDGNLLYGIDFSGADGWGLGATDSNSSRLPTALIGQNITFPSVDNGQYTGTRTVSSVEQIFTLVSNPANWTTDNASGLTLDSTDFTIRAVPEPSSVAFLGVVGLCLYGWNRRRNRRDHS